MNSDSFALKQMKKYGWEPGQGLGRLSDGLSEPIKVKRKSNNSGLGFSKKQPVANFWSDVFNDAAARISTNKTFKDGRKSKNNSKSSESENSIDEIEDSNCREKTRCLLAMDSVASNHGRVTSTVDFVKHSVLHSKDLISSTPAILQEEKSQSIKETEKSLSRKRKKNKQHFPDKLLNADSTSCEHVSNDCITNKKRKPESMEERMGIDVNLLDKKNQKRKHKEIFPQISENDKFRSKAELLRVPKNTESGLGMSDADLFAFCKGATCHPAARFGIKSSGKLSRVANLL